VAWGQGCWTIVFVGVFILVLVALITAAERKDVKGVLSYGKWLAIPFAIAVILPNASTVKLMAVASAADAASKTQLGARGLEAVDALLDKVIKEAKK
jgi:uncharacterized integral membrane protein